MNRGQRRRAAIAAMTALLLALPGAYAAPPRAGTLASQPRPRLCVHVFARGSAVAAARALTGGLAAALAREPRLDARSLDSLLVDTAEEDQELARADEQVQTARRKLVELDLAEATRLLKDALAAYEKNLQRLADRPHPEAPMLQALKLLAATRFIDGDEEAAREALRGARVLDPDFPYDAKLFPPNMQRLYTENKLLFDELGKGALAVSSDPPGAEVLVNGNAAGVTPIRLEGLGAGPNYITLLATGFAPTTVTAEVMGGEETKLEQKLARFDDDPVPTLERTRAGLGEPVASSAMRDLGRRAGAALMLLGSVVPEANRVRVRLYLYDLRSGRLVRQVKRVVPEAELAAAGSGLVATLDAGAFASGEVEVVTRPAAPAQPNIVVRYVRRWRHWRYFWHSAAILGVVVLTSTVVGIAVASQDRGMDPRWPLILSTRGPGFSF